jgi:predicted nucleic acid-binding protein
MALALKQLIGRDAPLFVPGIVCQELLSGIREPAHFARMQRILEGFPFLLATKEEHVLAARVANACRKAGIATTTPDCLIAATTIVHDAWLLTTDRDFELISQHSELRLFHLKNTT